MSKYFKLFLSVCLIACMAVCLGLFAVACNPADDDDDKDTNTYFSVTVKLPDDTVVSGVEAQICTLNGTIQTCLDAKVTTGADGVAKFNLSSPVDVTDTTLFLVKLHNLPDGYIYADAQGVEYAEGYGDKFDVTVTGYSVTVKLTEEVLDETTHKMTIGETVIAYNDHTYKFTAPKTGSYKFSAFADKWTIDGERQSEEQVLKNLTANQKVTLTITNDEDYAGSLYVNYGEGSNLDPVALTLGQQNPLEVTLIKVNLRGSEKLVWNTDEYHYCYKFTPAESGTYNIYVTSSFDFDEISLDVISSDGNSMPDVIPDMDDWSLWTADLTANVEYILTVGSVLNEGEMGSYIQAGATEGQKLTIDTKIETAENGGNDEGDTVQLTLNESVEAVSNKKYIFSAAGGGNFTVTVSGVADEDNFWWTVNNQTQEASITSTTVSLLPGSNMLSVEVGGTCTITLTEATGDAIPEVELNTPHNFSETLTTLSGSGATGGLTWTNYHYTFTFTTDQAGTYTVTINYGHTNDCVDCDISNPEGEAGYSDMEYVDNGPDSAFTGITYTFSELEADTLYTVQLSCLPDYADYSSLAEGATLTYTVTVDYVA